MPHDAHFLERLDRVDRKHVELALGLYRDHELVRYILSHTRLAEGVERIAIALEEGSEAPHIIVARTGAFVTCLGRGMSTGVLPVVTRAHLDGLASKFQRVREGLELAKKRGVDETRLLDRIESAGPAITREDFLAACAILGPAVPLLRVGRTGESRRLSLCGEGGVACRSVGQADACLLQGAVREAQSRDRTARGWVGACLYGAASWGFTQRSAEGLAVAARGRRSRRDSDGSSVHLLRRAGRPCRGKGRLASDRADAPRAQHGRRGPPG